MHTITLDFADAKQMEKAVHHLWDRLSLSGEVHAAPNGAAWRLNVTSEKTLRRDTIAALGGQLVQDSEEPDEPNAQGRLPRRYGGVSQDAARKLEEDRKHAKRGRK